MIRPFFVVAEKGDVAKVAYFGDDHSEAQATFNKLTRDVSIDSLQLFHTPIPTSTFNPKAHAALEKMEVEALKNAKDLADAAEKQAARVKLEQGKALIAAAEAVLGTAPAPTPPNA